MESLARKHEPVQTILPRDSQEPFGRAQQQRIPLATHSERWVLRTRRWRREPAPPLPYHRSRRLHYLSTKSDDLGAGEETSREFCGVANSLPMRGLDHNSRAVSHLSKPGLSSSTPAASTNSSEFIKEFARLRARFPPLPRFRHATLVFGAEPTIVSARIP